MQPWKISVGFTVIIIAVAAMMGGERFAYLEPHFQVIFPRYWTGLAWHGGLAHTHADGCDLRRRPRFGLG